ncbi:thioredoxin [Thalassoroseus pseudoceratinae]|uniref:thioredoxin n=1 Tax=Thalassoroseus pseudoceratinae TaxID=2713176 RepID=UPI00141FD8D5|nr:thioredoxin [Thalassoroseus pseudoceratinae]
MSDATMTFTDDNFESEVLQSDQPVLVDFWAPWCGPCKRLGPTIDELAADYQGKVKVGKMNTDENMQVPQSLGISAIPTVLLFKNGEIADNGRFVGLTPKEQFVQVLDASAG